MGLEFRGLAGCSGLKRSFSFNTILGRLGKGLLVLKGNDDRDRCGTG